MHKQTKVVPGFTLVELLIVIVVIAILAAITIVAYNGIQQRAQVASLQSDLRNVSKKFELFNAENGSYPATVADLISLGAKFSFSPVGSNVLVCYDATGYALFVRATASSYDGQYVMTGGSPAATSTLFPNRSTASYWSSSNLCPKTPYANGAWGGGWVTGG